VIKHYESCTADYPEKKAGERPKEVTPIDLGNGELAINCNDCGAYEIVEKREAA